MASIRIGSNGWTAMVRTICGLILGACFSLAPPSHAASISERSVVRPGLWWDASQAGSGFEIHVSPGQLFVIWYTYRADGSPVWYTAQAAMDSAGHYSAPLLRHRWSDGRYAGNLQVGTLAFERLNTEALTASFKLDGRDGTLSLVPYPISGINPEVDHSGAWYQPDAGGYGLTIGEQGEWLTAGYYIYDAGGEPTWLFGTNDGGGTTLSLNRFSGSCPGCSYQAPAATAAIGLSLNFSDETRMQASVTDAQGALAPDWRRSDQSLQMVTTPASQRAADRQLASFDDAAALETYLKAALLRPTTPPASVVLSAATTPLAASSTNVVEAGVDEADVMKSDGRYVYTFAADTNGRRLPQVRVAQIVDAASPLLPQPPIAVRAEDTLGSSVTQMYLTDTSLVALTGTQPRVRTAGAQAFLPASVWTGGTTRVEIFDRTDPAHPISRFSASLDGHLVDSRRIGDQLYLITRWTPQVSGVRGNAMTAAELAQNQGALDATPLEQLLPRIAIGGAAPVALVRASSVVLPPTVTRQAAPEYASITRLRLSNPDDRETLSVVGTVESVYVSGASLYLATSRYEPQFDAALGYHFGGFTATDVHQVLLDGSALAVRNTGSVEGYVGRDPVRTPFRFSELDGKLRVVTSGDWGALGQNRVSLIEPSHVAPGNFHTLSFLPNHHRPEPLGKVAEQLYATRFVGDRLYAVTFRSVDPMDGVDLKAIDDPRIAGSIELPGFSDYLHPLPNGLLLGMGKDSVPATGVGDGRGDWYQGLKLVLFDVNDPAHPNVLDQRLIGKRGSDSALLHDHHGFSAITTTDRTFRFAIPMRVHDRDGSEPAAPAASYNYPYQYSALFCFDVSGASPAASRLVAFPALVTDRRGSAAAENDDAASGARSVLLDSGAVYVEKGNFWDAPWSATDRPLGPF